MDSFRTEIPYCPVCLHDLTVAIKDVLRKTDQSRFECEACNSDLIATAVRVITVERDKEAEDARRQP